MAITHVGGANNTAAGPGTTVAVTRTMTAGSLALVWLQWSGGDTTVSISDGSNTLVNGTKVTNTVTALFAWQLAAAGGSTTFTATVGASRTAFKIILLEFAYDASIALDTQNTGTGTGDFHPASGAITTAATDEVVIGGYGDVGGSTTSTEEINGVGATEPAESPAGGTTSAWYRILTATFAGGIAEADISGSEAWICNIVAFKAVGSAALTGTATASITEADIV